MTASEYAAKLRESLAQAEKEARGHAEEEREEISYAFLSGWLKQDILRAIEDLESGYITPDRKRARGGR